MKLLVACEFAASALDELRSLGTELVYRPGLTGEVLAGAMKGVGILVVDAARVPPEAIHNGGSLQMIVRTGGDLSNIAVEEASADGIFVVGIPHHDAAAIAELAIGLAIALDRRIVENVRAIREGGARASELAEGGGLSGRTLGIFGYGPVGREIARRAAGFDLHVLAWCSTLASEHCKGPEVEFCTWPRELARKSDIVVVHAPLGDDEIYVDDEFIGAMRDGSYLVHIGQLGALDETAVLHAVERRRLRLAIDVWSPEAATDLGRLRSRLLECGDVLATQDLGRRTQQARDAVALEAVRIILQYLVAGELPHCANLLERSPATWQLVLRLRDTVGVMASIMEAIRADGINAEEITSRVFSGAQAAWCTISLDERPSTEALDTIRSLRGVLHLDLRAVV